MTVDLSITNGIKARAVATIDRIAGVAGRLDMTDTEEEIRSQGRQLSDDTFRIIVAGRFKNGKSTLLNALLGNPGSPIAGLASGRGPMPSHDLPTTAVLTTVSYSDEPFVRKFNFEGEVEEWSFERYLVDARVKSDSVQNEKFFSTIREFQVGYPAEICRQGIVIIDSPGTDDVPQRTTITDAAARTCDLAIVVFRSDVLAGGSEREFVNDVIAIDGTKNFVVVNLMNGRKPEEDLKAFTWNRLVNLMRKGPTYSGQDFESEEIYFVDARLAESGTFGNRPDLLLESGIERFEQRLAKFLTEERHRHHIEKFVKAAIRLGRPVLGKIHQRIQALEEEAEALKQKYASTQKELAKLDQPKGKIGSIVEKHRKRAVNDVIGSFQLQLMAVQRDLPELLAAFPLPSEGWASFLHAEQLAKEAADFCNQVIAERMSQWSHPGGPAAQALDPICNDLMEDVLREVERFESIYNAFHFGVGKDNEGKPVVDGWGQRLQQSIEDSLGPELQLRDGALGWGGTATSLAGYALTAFAGLVLGLSFSALIPLAVVGAFLAQMLRGKAFLPDLIKAWVLEKVNGGDKDADPPRLPLMGILDLARQPLTKAVDEYMEKLHGAILKAVSNLISEEQKNLQEIVGNSERTAEEKRQLMQKLEAMARELTSSSDELRHLLAEADQVMA